MIDWIISIFYFGEKLGILSFEMMITVNLSLLIVCRGLLIAIISYILYKKDFLVKNVEGYNEARRHFISFSFKQITIIVAGMIYLPISVFFSLYALLKLSKYLSDEKSVFQQKFINLLGRIMIFLIPLVFILWFGLFEQDIFSVSSIGLCILIFFFREKDTSLNILGISRHFFHKFHPLLRSIFLILVISLPTTIIIASGIYQAESKFTVMVEMDDGVHLSTDVYFAPGSFGNPRPVILIRTPYGKSGWADDLYLPFYLLQNYHVVIQDLRGTFASEGGNNFLLFTKSYLDGVDTIEWILKQEWCNGKIASAGVSALCINQYFYAGMGPQGLEAQSLWFGTPELFDHAIFQGSYHKSSVETWVQSTAPDNWQYQIETIFNYIPKNETLYNSTSLSISIGPHYSNVSVRALHVGGWYDHFLQGTLDGFVGYDDNGTSRAFEHQKLIMGPWTHGSIYGGKQGELTYPQNSNGFDLIFDWESEVFDEALLGIPANWDGARVAYYLMGDINVSSNEWNYWRYAYDWPLDYVNDVWYLNGDGSLTNNSIGLISKNYTYLYDPRFPVPNLGGQNQPFDLAGPYDQRPVENRPDVLIFETPVLTEAIETVGRIWGHLYVSSNCTDTDFTVKITDVYPNNRSMLVTDGSLTVRFRNNYTAESLMTGDQTDVYELWVDCWSSAYVFAPGHKIRVAISSSNYPRFGINPNTGVPLAYDYLNYNIANNTLLVGPERSSIILPRLVNLSTTHTYY